MVTALESGENGPGSSPGRGHRVVFLGKALNSHSASLHPGISSGSYEPALAPRLRFILEAITTFHFHHPRIRSTVTLPTELRGGTEKVGDDLGGESRRRESKGTYECCAA